MRRWRIQYNQNRKKTGREGTGCTVCDAGTCAVKTAQGEVGCGGNEDVKMDEWSHQAGQNY